MSNKRKAESESESETSSEEEPKKGGAQTSSKEGAVTVPQKRGTAASQKKKESSESEDSTGEDEEASSSEEEEKPQKKQQPKKKTAPVRKTKKKKKDPNQPKRPITSYMFFMKLRRADYQTKYPNMKFGDLSKKMAAEWKGLDPEEKKPYEEEHKKDKLRYEKEMKNYKKPDSGSSSSDSSSEEKPRKRKPAKKRPKKDPNAPKRPVNAYMFFTKEKRDQVREKYPELPMVDISKKLGAMWKLLEPTEKDVFQKMAADDKLRWEKEQKQYLANGDGNEDDDD